MEKERDYFFDNLKAVLIFLVVLGHFLLPIHGKSVLVIIKRLIYVFHMPLFVFVSGYFSKKIYKDGQYNFKKILFLIKAYIIFVVAIQAVYAVCGVQSFSEINFFSNIFSLFPQRSRLGVALHLFAMRFLFGLFVVIGRAHLFLGYHYIKVVSYHYIKTSIFIVIYLALQ